MNRFTLRSGEFRRPRHQAGSYRWVSRFFTLASAVIVIGAHGVWLVMAGRAGGLQAQPETRASGPVVSYMDGIAGSAGEAGRDVRLLRSPVLMSLPTRAGFSGPLLGPARPEQPPRIDMPATEFLRGLDEPFGVGPYGKSLRPLEVLASRLRTPRMPETVVRDRALTPAPASSPRLVAYWQDQPGLEPEPLVLESVSASNNAWEAVLLVRLAEGGLVEQVLLENATADAALNLALVRAIRGTIFRHPPAGGTGRLVVRYQPREAGKKG